MRIEDDVSQFRPFLLHDDLVDQRLVFVDIQIEYVDLTIGRTCCEHCRRVWCPSDITYSTAQIVDEQRIPEREG